MGIPLGIAAHRLLVDQISMVVPESMKDVRQALQLAGIAPWRALVIAVLGALVPARRHG
ncbi:hypothetical protein HW130_10580 [Streptomyces sp. PKU-EA00015]|uniref:hypothetical protein n=1 Tax=Streptomyces sp. PKU-EA00015 TaxID=2748326 RepID=UPI0015A18CD7|nr:hypothetical protein [Streptomyces sp. PKU-EA00015]NWF26714.1 hypothetical protein [Streptomyces sp. PKU-EA00015]